MAYKKTKKEMFNEILAIVKDNEEMRDFIKHEIDLLDKKSANKRATKTQVENEGFKAEIKSVLTENGSTVTEIQGKSEILAGLSNQRVSALLRQMVADGEVVKTIDKKKSYFAIATVDEG